jgi:uncharacterized protein
MQEPPMRQSPTRQPPTPQPVPLGRLVALVIALVLAAACAIGGDGDGGSDGPGTASPSGRDQRRAEQPSTEEFQRDLEGAVQVAEQYWRDRFAALGRQFVPVRRIVPYTREGEVACGGQPVPKNNAVYCSAGDFIAYDVNFATLAFSRVGDAFLFYLLSHEYAHAIQTRLGIQYTLTIEQELQADCMAGALLGDSIRAGTLKLEEGDIAEFREGLLAVGDDPSIPWFAPGAHGTAQQRTNAFFSGYEQSLAPCGSPAAAAGIPR